MRALIRWIQGKMRKPAPALAHHIHVHPTLRLDPGKAGFAMSEIYWRQRRLRAEIQFELAARRLAAAILDAMQHG